ncbi:MAG: S8 family serine peptidase, partial [Acidimicrobiia bacterium]|nr:S8 family serine peptidase [Acidimicrobiia bacterium]
MTTRKRLSAGLLATAIAAGGAVVALDFDPGSADGKLPPAPPLLEMSAPEPVLPGDGLERFIVTIPSTVAESESSTGAGSDSDGVAPAPTDDSGDSADAGGGLLDVLPDEAERIVVSDGLLGYLDSDGVFTALGEGAGRGGDGGTGEPSMADTLAGLPGVESVEAISDGSFAVRTSEPEQLGQLTDLGVTVTEEMFLAFTADPYEPYQWTLDNTGTNLSGASSLPNVEQTPDADIDGVEARLGATGEGAVVAIVDSGVDLSHPELVNAAWVNPGEDCDSATGNGIDDDGNGYIDDCSGWDFGDNDREMFDGSNSAHGTHVSGIVAAQSGNGQGVAGVAPDAKIMDLKVADRWGAIPSASIAMAIRYAVDNGADVVNLSLGSQPGAPLASAAEMASAVDYARVNGVLLVVAAGNNGISLDSAPVYPASLNTSNMIVVGATDPTDHRTSFSNFGSAVDLFGPGLYILSTTPNGQLAFQSGTSQASPVVAGAAALAVESLGTSNPSAVIDRLTASADSLPQLHGQAANPLRVNAARAVGVAVGAVGTSDGAGDAGGSAGSVGSVTVRGLAGDETGRVSASIAIAVEDEALDQPFRWEASLFALERGRLFAIPDHEVTAGPTGDSQPELTDDRGAVVLAADTSQSAEWDTVLPGGTYALLIEAVPESDPDTRLGDGFLATFVVAGASTDDGGSGSGSDSGG